MSNINTLNADHIRIIELKAVGLRYEAEQAALASAIFDQAVGLKRVHSRIADALAVSMEEDGIDPHKVVPGILTVYQSAALALVDELVESGEFPSRYPAHIDLAKDLLAFGRSDIAAAVVEDDGMAGYVYLAAVVVRAEGGHREWCKEAMACLGYKLDGGLLGDSTTLLAIEEVEG